MNDSFAATFNRQLAASGKTLSQVASIAGIDRAYVLRLSRGEKVNPSPVTVVRLFLGLVFDERIVERDLTMVEGLTELLLAAATSSATHHWWACQASLR